MAETRFKLVPVEPTDEMVEAAQEEISERQKVGCGVFLADIWPVALQVAPEPSPEMVDDLCKAMWPNAWWWGTAFDPRLPAEYVDEQRRPNREMMSAFLQRIGEQK